MPALRFKTCRLLPGNVWNRELSLIQRRILQRLRKKRKSKQRKLYLLENRKRNIIKLQTTRKLSLIYGGLPRMHRGRERTSYIPFLLKKETRLDVIPVRLHFSQTLPQARQLISHRKVCVNNGLVSITHWKVSHGDLISFPENEARTRGEEIRRSFYIDILVGKILVKSLLPVRRWWGMAIIEWFRRLLIQIYGFGLLKTKRECRRLLKSWLLRQLRSSMRRKKDLERKKFGSAKVDFGSSSFAEYNRKKRHFLHFTYLQKKNQNLPISPFFDCPRVPPFSLLCPTPVIRRKIRIKRIELPTHYSEVNYRTLKAVVSYGPNIGQIPHDIRLKDLNLGNGRGKNI